MMNLLLCFNPSGSAAGVFYLGSSVNRLPSTVDRFNTARANFLVGTLREAACYRSIEDVGINLS
jgi:hypothetical protein